jgi:hypothetical protein
VADTPQDWPEEKKQKAREAIKRYDGIKLYRSAGRLGLGAKHAADSNELARKGGLDPAEALDLARMKMVDEHTGGDPNWQGPIDMNTGPREPEETSESIAKRRDAFFAADREERARIMAAENRAVRRSRERFYDDLVQPQKVTQAEALTQSVKAKRKG